MSKLDLDKPVQTRAGQAARIICRDAANSMYSIIALVKGSDGMEYPRTFTIAGRYNGSNADNGLDLVNVPEPQSEYLFVGGTRDGHREFFDDSAIRGGAFNSFNLYGEEYFLRVLPNPYGPDLRVFGIKGTGRGDIFSALVKNYRAAAPAKPAEAGPVGACGGDGVVGVRDITSVRDIFLVWTYYSGESAMLRAAHVTRRAADDAAQNYAMILPPGQGAYVTKQSLS